MLMEHMPLWREAEWGRNEWDRGGRNRMNVCFFKDSQVQQELAGWIWCRQRTRNGCGKDWGRGRVRETLILTARFMSKMSNFVATNVHFRQGIQSYHNFRQLFGGNGDLHTKVDSILEDCFLSASQCLVHRRRICICTWTANHYHNKCAEQISLEWLGIEPTPFCSNESSVAHCTTADYTIFHSEHQYSYIHAFQNITS